MFGITRHAESQLRSRTGWTKRAVRRAVQELPTKGRKLADGEWAFRKLRWLVSDQGKVITVFPLTDSPSNGRQDLAIPRKGIRRHKPKGKRHQ